MHGYNSVSGIVRFEVSYSVSGSTVGTSQNVPVTDIHREGILLNMTVEDGEKVEICVKAFDIFEKYAEDNLTIYKDTTEPTVTNLWLVRDDLTNLTVHTLKELTELQ